MRKTSFFLPALGMGLLYCSLNMMMTVVNLRGSSRVGKGDPTVLLHFGLVALVALGIYLLVRQGLRRLRPLAAVLAAAGLFCVSIPAMPADVVAAFSGSRPPVFSLCMSLFLPVSFYLFFRTAPDGKEGFAFALVIAANELLWTLIFPLISLLAPQEPRVLGMYLFSLCCWMIGGGGICLALSVSRIARIPDSTPLVIPYAAASPIPFLREKRTALCLIAVARIAVFGTVGLSMGMFLPKTAMTSGVSSLPLFLFVILFPLIGRMVDTHPGKLILFYIPGLLAAFCLSQAYANGAIGQMTLFYPLSIAQQTTWLLMVVATSRMLKTHAVFPLVIVLGYCLHPAHIGGMALRGLVQGVPYGVAAASLALTAGAAFCLWRFRALLGKEPELWTLPRTENEIAPVPEPGAKPSAWETDYAAFGLKFGLSEREILVVTMLAQGRSTDAIATDLQVAESTVRTYVSRILRKTGVENRAALMGLFTAQG